MQASLRPAMMTPSELSVRGELSFDCAQRFVSMAGKLVHPTINRYDLPREFSLHTGQVPTHQHLLQG